MLNPYKFSVYRNGACTTPGATFGKVAFDTKEFDTGSNFDNTTNYRFIAPVGGFYQLNTSVGTGGNVTRLIVSLFKNGVEVKRLYDSGGISGNPAAGGGACLMQLSANDYVEVFIFTSSAVTGAGNLITRFDGFLLSAN